MTDITPNHLHIYRDRRGKHITLDGHELLLDAEDPMLITGMENPAEVTRVMLTLLAPKITADSEIEDREPEPATVDAPEPTLAEELRDTARWWREGAPTWEQCCDRFESLAARAEQIEQERDWYFKEVENVRTWKEALINERDQARSEVKYLDSEIKRLTAERDAEVTGGAVYATPDGRMGQTQYGTFRPAADLPDPADVKPGEAWLVQVDGKAVAALRIGNGRWVTASGTGFYVWTHGVERLVSSLLPEVTA